MWVEVGQIADGEAAWLADGLYDEVALARALSAAIADDAERTRRDRLAAASMAAYHVAQAGADANQQCSDAFGECVRQRVQQGATEADAKNGCKSKIEGKKDCNDGMCQGKCAQVGARWHDDDLRAVDAWRRRQADIPSRTEAIRQLTRLGLSMKPKKRTKH